MSWCGNSAISNAKKCKVNQEIPPAVANQDFEFESTGKKVMEPNRFDFEAVLRSSDIQLPTSQSNPPQEAASINLSLGSHPLASPALQFIPPVSAQSTEQLGCSGDEIFAHVPMSLRQQICNREYINLALLWDGATRFL